MDGFFRIVSIVSLCLLASSAVHADAALVGHWTFDGSLPGAAEADKTGNFPDLVLQGTANIACQSFGGVAPVTCGQLEVGGAGTTATGWARTDPTGSYGGPPITNKTLMSCIILKGLGDVASSGSALTINRPGQDYFDGIVFAERQGDRWMAGSTLFARTQDFIPGFQETAVYRYTHIAITYEHTGGGNIRVSGYRNGQLIGQYDMPNASNWGPGDAEVFFGIRHISTGGAPVGALDAWIDEARIYDEVLTQAQIAQIINASCDVAVAAANPVPAPAISRWGIIGFSLLAAIGSILALRRRSLG